MHIQVNRVGNDSVLHSLRESKSIMLFRRNNSVSSRCHSPLHFSFLFPGLRSSLHMVSYKTLRNFAASKRVDSVVVKGIKEKFNAKMARRQDSDSRTNSDDYAVKPYTVHVCTYNLAASYTWSRGKTLYGESRELSCALAHAWQVTRIVSQLGESHNSALALRILP